MSKSEIDAILRLIDAADKVAYKLKQLDWDMDLSLVETDQILNLRMALTEVKSYPKFNKKKKVLKDNKKS